MDVFTHIATSGFIRPQLHEQLTNGVQCEAEPTENSCSDMRLLDGANLQISKIHKKLKPIKVFF